MPEPISLTELREAAEERQPEQDPWSGAIARLPVEVEADALLALLDIADAAQTMLDECPTCFGDGYIERPERVIGEADNPCPTCSDLRDALNHTTT